jgi:hypothetical protein
MRDNNMDHPLQYTFDVIEFYTNSKKEKIETGKNEYVYADCITDAIKIVEKSKNGIPDLTNKTVYTKQGIGYAINTWKSPYE